MTTHNKDYVHGYSSREAERLLDQAGTLTDLLHSDTHYPAGSRVLEVGCGIGAQTITLCTNSPRALFTCIDFSDASLAEAETRVRCTGLENAKFRKADIYNLPFSKEDFDHVFICFVLEHLPDPAGALSNLKALIKPGGTITVIEGDHGSAYFYPDSQYAKQAIDCLVTLQKEMGGNSMIGRELYPLLVKTGFNKVMISPRMIYADASRPDLVQGFTRQTFTAMVEGVREAVLERGMMKEENWDQAISDLYRTTGPDGVFCYTMFKGTGSL